MPCVVEDVLLVGRQLAVQHRDGVAELMQV